MMHALDGTTPDVADTASVSAQAYLVGDVTVGGRSSLWPFTCLRGDTGPVTVGDETNVQEFSMLHGAELGDEVTVGHGAVVDFALVDDHVLVGIGSAVLSGATVESNCIVAANAVVLQDQTVPEGHMAYGTPAETRPLTDEQIAGIGRTHAHYVERGKQFVDVGPHEHP